ncbi:phenylalanine--tRNA ligase subunit alpha [Candidatus Kuenenbacteria bacterium]|nr:phenylalanine--tRNA ligase subunit alpha [Candidatus Kuenenbacteria bacterium]
MQIKLQKLKQEILDKLAEIKQPDILRDLEVKYLGRKGEFTKILRCLKNLTIQEKKEIGQLANEIKKELQEKFEEVKNVIVKNVVKRENLDVTLPGEKILKGHLHPITIIQNELEDLFTSMGFMILDGPELESDYYNFEALNIPKYHPARDMQDTFYIDHKNKDNEYDLVMRTQVTSIQVRAVQKYGASIRCIMPGRVFRAENADVCHDHTFYQMDGFMIGKDISVANLIAVSKELLKGIFKREVEIRIRPGYFPFVEPGIEIDMRCTICNGKGCPSCKNSGWLEMLPGGLIHPKVLMAGGLDPKKYNGLAFDVGLTRLAMMKYGINDIRLFNSGDLRFLEQF